MAHDSYETPLGKRYASREMLSIYSDDTKFSTWRRLWIALAESEKELGLDITDEQIDEMKAHIDDIDYDFEAKKEAEVRHDVMAHVLTYGECCPKARSIIHLGATSCYVGDNTDIIQTRMAMLQIKRLLLTCMKAVAEFADRYKELPTLAYTHFQAAQPTTVGKRAALWLQDLLLDYEQLDFQLANLKLLGCRGTTGTAASFLELFGGDHEKVKQLDTLIAKKMGFENTYPVSGQTYSRKLDFNVMSVLSGIAQSAHKFSNDFRLLSHLKEFDEPFEDKQIGSSAMAYKRNPMRSERIASLSRYIMCDLMNPAMTASEQWFERTLDDSANRRISIPEAFLATDAILQLYINIISGCRVYPKIIARHLNDELPFMATENILMYCVTHHNGDRQTLHEAIRVHSVSAAQQVKANGGDNDLIERILADERFGVTREEIDALMSPELFTGRAKEQTTEFLEEYINPLLAGNESMLNANVNIKV